MKIVILMEDTKGEQEAFDRMKEIMGDQLVAIHAGDRIERV